jgi:pyruvate dehydrogenase E2 component (dihydrolipoamide acetyltransferase)
MPQLGLTMTEGTVLHWLKGEGDLVQKGEPVLEIETDKVVVEIEAPANGVLGPILASEGTVIPIGQVISYVLAPGEEAPAETKATIPGEPVAGEAEMPPSTPKRAPTPLASPKARRLAEHLGVDLTTVEGTARGGRIVAADVERAAERAEVTLPARPPIVTSGDVEPLRGARRIAAERMTYSFTSTPHFYLTAEVDATAAVRMREGLLS